MLAGQVTAPVIRLAQLWQDFQQVGISVERLGDILNAITETPKSRLALPEIKGQIDFENISFKYKPEGKYILSNISFSIQVSKKITT